MAEAAITCVPENTRTDTLQIAPINISAGPGLVLFRGKCRDTDGKNLIKCQTILPDGESGRADDNPGTESALLLQFFESNEL